MISPINVSIQSVYRLAYIAVIFSLLSACNKSVPAGQDPNTPSFPAQINFTSPGVFPEGIAYDADHYRFFVSSATTGVVGTVTADGTYKAFITDSLLASGSSGIKVDKARQRVWVCNTTNGVRVYDLSSGKRIFFTDVTSLLPGQPVFLNDELLDADGNAYVTNSFSPVIYKITKDGKASVFFNNDVFAVPPGGFGLNGIQISPKGYLLVAFATGVTKIPINNPGAFSIVKFDSTGFYPDGLLLSKDGKQLVVVNDTGGTPDDQVLSFISNDDWTSGTESTKFPTGPVFPSDAASDGSHIFVVYSHIDKIGTDLDVFTIQQVALKVPTTF